MFCALNGRIIATGILNESEKAEIKRFFQWYSGICKWSCWCLYLVNDSAKGMGTVTAPLK